MITAILVLFFTVVLSSFLVKAFPPHNNKWLKLALAFSGAYLFSITIIHLLPDMLLGSSKPHTVGYWVLGGCFLQLVLEQFSEGVEHGHIHLHKHDQAGPMPFLLLGSLFLHSFLEGSILIDNGSRHLHQGHEQDNFYLVLMGVALHHVPAAFALMSVLMSRLGSFNKAFMWLLIFAVGSPLGIIVSNTVLASGPDSTLYNALTGLVVGNFLHISTTILFETSPDHHFNRNKLMATFLGLFLALVSNFI